MTMKPSVLRALESVSRISKSAMSLATSITSPEVEAELQALHSQISELQREILTLRMALQADPNAPMSDIAKRDLSDQFLQHLKSQDLKPEEIVVKYDKAFFLNQDPEVRVVVALCISNFLAAQKKPSSAIILDVIATNGAL